MRLSNGSESLPSINEGRLQKALSSLPLGGLRYFDSIGSTNDDALSWAAEGGPDLSLVISNEQTAGRGRSGRKWITPPGSAVAFSLIMRPTPGELEYPARITGLGALALLDTLRSIRLFPQIKWPNDVLVNGRKVAGILVESQWLGDILQASILGIGVNVLNGSSPPPESAAFPATCIEDELKHPLDRAVLIKDILSAILNWRDKIGGEEFLEAWEDSLAFRGQQVQVTGDTQLSLTGELIGLEQNGNLRLRTPDGYIQRCQFGEIHLRPVL
jgi:BirA family transcriptional regulator, biotin operon repressor / biotin---[acetyl-CoA-carboxylase] ligase